MPLVSISRQLLAQLFNRFLKFLVFTRGFKLRRLINRFFAALTSFRRWIRTNPHQRQGPPISSATLRLDNGIVCAMNVPSSGPSDAHEHSRPSPVDSPYTSARSPSGHLAPYSPTPERRYSRDHIPWMTGSQTSLHDEPRSINHNAPQAADGFIPQSSSSTGTHIHPDNHTPTSDIHAHPSPPPSPLHRMIGFAPETSSGNPGFQTFPHLAHIRFDANHRSRTPSSIKSSSQRSGSQKSCTSRNSTGRASYREHRGPPARVRIPTPKQDASVFGPSPSSILRIAEPGGSITPGNIIAPPSVGNPNRPGEPTNGGFRFEPFSPYGVSRYDNRAIRSPSAIDHTIDAMTYEYPETPDNISEGWTAYRHPGGALYFVHNESKTFTELNVRDEEIHTDVEYFRRFLFSELETEIMNRNLCEYLKVCEVQLVLEPKVDGEGVMCCYYFVNPRARSLFWLDKWDGDEIFEDCRGSLSLPHKGLGIQAHYWRHCDVYPNFCEVTQELKDEVLDMILHATCAHLTSNTSASPLNPEELKSHLSLIDRIDPKKTDKRAHCAIIISRIMHVFYRNRFVHFYGEDCARLNFDQTVHGWRYHPSLLMKTFAPLLFLAPVNNVRLLHRVFVDDVASQERWNMFIKKLNSQLQETSVLATVLLNANVGFLPKQSGTGTSPQQFFSYMSLVANMASIILGLVFMGHSRTEARNTPPEVVSTPYLPNMCEFSDWNRPNSCMHYVTKRTVLRNSPSFTVFRKLSSCGGERPGCSFAVQWCYPDDTRLRASAAAFVFIAVLLVAWCIWTARGRCDFWWFQSDPKQAQHREVEEEEGDGVSPGILRLCFLRRY
ncbi:hypothetical protein J3R82DRAFT_7117 [Butyriboletus roseoflavus]|nr:hypothetical protein J3R82DRAFT_7117 [Butyriboletus roseoflavus]